MVTVPKPGVLKDLYRNIYTLRGTDRCLLWISLEMRELCKWRWTETQCPYCLLRPSSVYKKTQQFCFFKLVLLQTMTDADGIVCRIRTLRISMERQAVLLRIPDTNMNHCEEKKSYRPVQMHISVRNSLRTTSSREKTSSQTLVFLNASC